MHKESVFTLKWDALAGEEGITKGAPTNIYALQSPWVHTLAGTATKEKKETVKFPLVWIGVILLILFQPL